MANAVQGFTVGPAKNQTQDSLLTDCTLLSILIIPHLETYFTAHADVRFLLLEYPAEHLPTVLSLQKLIGADTVKVAGILNGEDPAHVPETRQARSLHGPGRPNEEGPDAVAA